MSENDRDDGTAAVLRWADEQLQRCGYTFELLRLPENDGPLGGPLDGSPAAVLRFAAAELRYAAGQHHTQLAGLAAVLGAEQDRAAAAELPSQLLAPLARECDDWANGLQLARQRLERAVDAALAAAP